MQGIAIRQIACGANHTMILKENNEVLVFGYRQWWSIRIRK